ncbi:peptidase [Mycena vulgaris]|nr:peptidase [Mycena vulgaris]
MLLSILPAIALAAWAVGQDHLGQAPLRHTQVEKHADGEGLGPESLRLVQFTLDDAAPVWLTERQKLAAKANNTHFMDITDTPLLGWSPKSCFSYPAPNSTIVRGVLAHLTTAEPQANLEHFTSYHNRYYDSDTGKASAEWLHARIVGYTDALVSKTQKALISAEAIQHPWKQNSIVIRMAPLNASLTDPVTIIGAHIDSLNHDGVLLGAPGADDDGSGTVTILEAYRSLLVGNYLPVSPLEFHFYAGEEGGLRGSQALVSRYENAGRQVRGMVQFDMTAWHKAGTLETVAIITNDVDPALTQFPRLLVDRYYPLTGTHDHVSWTKAGYQTAHPVEGLQEHIHAIHGTLDCIDISPEFSFHHMRQFCKLAVAFVIEVTSN